MMSFSETLASGQDGDVADLNSSTIKLSTIRPLGERRRGLGCNTRLKYVATMNGDLRLG